MKYYLFISEVTVTKRDINDSELVKVATKTIPLPVIESDKHY